MARIGVRILNWDRYNERRKDVKHPTWFRMENAFARSESLFGLSAVTRCVWFGLLAHASEKQSGELDFDSAWFVHVHGAGAFTESELFTAIEQLKHRTIEVMQNDANVHVTDTARTRHADATLQDGHYEQDITNKTERTAPRAFGTYPPESRAWPPEIAALLPRLPLGAYSSLVFQFSEPFLIKHLRDAISYCDAKDGTVGKLANLKTVQRYLKIERDKPPNPFNKPKRTMAEMEAAGEV